VRYFALFLISAVSALAADPTIAGLLKRVEGRYNRAETLEVRFAETYAAAGRPARTETGTLLLRKPGKMRWEYSSPAGKLFVSDGKDVYLYLPSANRVEKMKLKESMSEDWRAPLAFLLGKLNFNKEFHNIQARPQGSGSVIAAEPKSANLPYSKVEFEVSSTFEIRKLHIIGQDQSVLDFVFDQERLNPPLATTLFQFRAPAGVEIVEGSQ
jgi:outer membrane lipoprotein carrier protein